MAGEAFPLPFLIESGGSRYAIVEQHNLSTHLGDGPRLKNTELWGVVIQTMAWIVEALRTDARSDFRKAPDEQAVAQFLCAGDEYQAIRVREEIAWHEANPDGTLEEFEAQFDIDEIDDSVRQPLPEWVFLIFDEGASWATENILQALGFRGVLYVWNTRTKVQPGLPENVWLVSPNPMLAAPDPGSELWMSLFADTMHAMLSYALPLSDGRDLWLEGWQFPTHRFWLAWNSGVPSGFVMDLKQRMVMHALELPDPVYIVEDRVLRLKPLELGGGWMEATRRMLQQGG